MSVKAKSPRTLKRVMADAASLRRWLALVVLCLAELIIVLDRTIVNVALSSIRTDLASL